MVKDRKSIGSKAFFAETLLLVIGIALASPAAHANDVLKAATDFEVPDVQTANLDVSGEDLFRYGDDENLSINLGSSLFFLSQTPMYTLVLTNDLSFDFGGVPEDRSHSFENEFQISYRRYFAHSRGIYLETSGGLDYENSNGDTVESNKMAAVNFGLGGGYGRILDTRTVSQAAAMCELAKTQCDAAKLLKIADIINKNNQGFYFAEYKLDGVRVFYKELSEAVGTADAFSLNQVLASPLYNITPKRVGFEIGIRLLGVHGDLVSDEGDDAGSDLVLQQYAGWATMLTPEVNLFVDQTLTHGMRQTSTASQRLIGHPGQKNNAATIRAGLNVDHSYTWATQAAFESNILMPNEGDTASNYALMTETNVAVGTRTVIGASFIVGNGDSTIGLTDQQLDLGIGDTELHWRAMLNFRHFIL